MQYLRCHGFSRVVFRRQPRTQACIVSMHPGLLPSANPTKQPRLLRCPPIMVQCICGIAQGGTQTCRHGYLPYLAHPPPSLPLTETVRPRSGSTTPYAIIAPGRAACCVACLWRRRGKDLKISSRSSRSSGHWRARRWRFHGNPSLPEIFLPNFRISQIGKSNWPVRFICRMLRPRPWWRRPSD